MANEIELERTYLVRQLPPEIKGVTPDHMIDVYVPDHGVDHPHLRLRARGGKYCITKKYPVSEGDNTRMVEETIGLDKIEFESMMNCSAAVIKKDRYKVLIDGFPAEVDVFQGKLLGLVMVDFEFKTEADLAKFAKPSWALAEVSNVHFLAGGLLAGKSYDDIAKDLAQLGYQKIE